jgi:hypothetical protein
VPPDGQITSDFQKTCQAHVSKIILFFRTQNQVYGPPVSPAKGRIMVVVTWVGMRWTRQRRARKGSQGGFSRERSTGVRRTALPTVFARTLLGPRVPAERSAEMGADGEVVMAWRPDLAPSSGRCNRPDRVLVHRQFRNDGGYRAGHPGAGTYKP